jgi:serine protease Do
MRRETMTRTAFLLVLLPCLAFAGAESRDSKVINDRADVLSAGRWIYNDFPKGVAEAKQSGKPLLVVLRCVP